MHANRLTFAAEMEYFFAYRAIAQASNDGNACGSGPTGCVMQGA